MVNSTGEVILAFLDFYRVAGISLATVLKAQRLYTYQGKIQCTTKQFVQIIASSCGITHRLSQDGTSWQEKFHGVSLNRVHNVPFHLQPGIKMSISA